MKWPCIKQFRSFLATFLILLFHSTFIYGAVLTVSNTNDSGAGSLRQQINDASSGDTIDFSITGTITLTSGEIPISFKDLVILGPGSDQLTLDGNNSSRIFNSMLAIVKISGLKFINGNSSSYGGAIYQSMADSFIISKCIFKDCTGMDGGALYSSGISLLDSCEFIDCDATQNGGAIAVEGSRVFITNCLFKKDSASQDGGAYYLPSGISDTLVFNNCTFDSCYAGSNGAAICADYSSSEGSIKNSTFTNNKANRFTIYFNTFDSVTLDSCTIDNNDAIATNGQAIQVTNNFLFTLNHTTVSNNTDQSAVGYFGQQLSMDQSRIIDNTSTSIGGMHILCDYVTIRNSTISGNTAYTGGIHMGASLVQGTILNSTISGNVSTNAFGIGGIDANGNLYMENSTIANNSTGASGAAGIKTNGGYNKFINCTVAGNTGNYGIYSEAFVPATDTFQNCIIDNPAGNYYCSTCNVSSLGYNISSDNTLTSYFTNTGDLNNTDPMLDTLSCNDGLTNTVPLQCGSPAIDPASGNGAPALDQRGYARIGTPDIGAFEYNDTLTWTGKIDSVWNNAHNWIGMVPDSCNIVIIPGTGQTPIQPHIFTPNAKCHEIFLDWDDNADLSIHNTGTLTIHK